MGYMIALFITLIAFAYWLEFRHKFKCPRKHRPYELIDLHEEIRKQRKKNEDR